MKIAIASSGRTLASPVDPRFGRCPYFLIVDLQTEEFEAVENTAGKDFRGAGITAAQMVADKGVGAVIAGNFGPNAVNVLNASGIKLFTSGGKRMTTQEALAQYKENKLQEVTMAAGPFGPGRGRREGCGGRGR